MGSFEDVTCRFYAPCRVTEKTLAICGNSDLDNNIFKKSMRIIDTLVNETSKLNIVNIAEKELLAIAGVYENEYYDVFHYVQKKTQLYTVANHLK